MCASLCAPEWAVDISDQISCINEGGKMCLIGSERPESALQIPKKKESGILIILILY